MRILFVATRFPHPPWRGDQARAFHQLKRLQRRHRLTLLTYGGAAASRAALDALGGVETVLADARPWDAPLRLARGLRNGTPLQAELSVSAGLRRRLRALLAERRHDLLHVQLARGAAALPARVPLPLVIDLIDALSLNMRRRQARDRGPLGWAARVEARRLRSFERELCARADLLTVVSEADRAAIGGFGHLRVNGNGVDLERLRPPVAPRDPRRLVFCGNLGYFPNVDAAVHLVREVLPLVWRDEPQARLALVGARPARVLRRLAAGDVRVELHADVPDVQPHLAAAAVALAPLRAGSGQLFKVLEALACATPVVATPLAVEGASLEDGRHVLLGRTPDELAAAVVRLLRGPALAARLGADGRAHVAARHSWDQVVGELEGLYAEAVARYARRASSSP